MEELASNYDIETPQYKEKQTILPHPMSEMEKKLQTPVKRTHDGKIKLKAESSTKKYQDGPSIDMRKLERSPGDNLTAIMSNGSLLETAKTPHKSKKKDKNHDKSSEKKKKSAKKEKSMAIPSTSITYNLNREEERSFKRLIAPLPTSTPSDKENNENVNSIDALIAKESEASSCGMMSMEMDDIPVVAEEVVVEETVIETTTSSNLMDTDMPPDFHISIQSTPHYTEEIVTETIVAFPSCSQTAP